MATLVLTAVGTALGGPIGGLLGSVAGQSIDSQWLTPARARRGPRLSDLRIQTSSYGTIIPRLYGMIRVAGTVIWATDLVERRDRRSGGKGQPKVTTYSYSASFAVALSSRKIAGIGRIWAEGNILRRSDGSFAERAGFRLHPGDEDQAPDALIVAAEGPDAAPAYRGLAYVVFEDMDLSPFGNRIPSLSFEVDAGDAALTLADVAADLIDTPLNAAGETAIGGFAAAGASIRDAVGPLATMLGISRSPGEPWLMPAATGGLSLPGTAGAEGPARAERSYGAADRLPQSILHSHYDPARDYQTSVQTAMLPGGRAPVDSIDLPVVQTADAARLLVEREAARLRAARTRMSWPGGLAALAVPPGVRVATDFGPMLVETRRIEAGSATLDLVAVTTPPGTAVAADGGRAVTANDAAVGMTVAAVFDLPAIVAVDLDAPRLALAASGTDTGWRRATATLTPNAGALPVNSVEVRSAAVLGRVIGWQGQGTALLWDRQSSVDVELLRADMLLSNAAPSDLLAGANAAMIGSEMIQFGLATPIGPRQWRLSELLRGRQGTEDAVAAIAVDAPFTLLDDPALLPLVEAALGPGGSIVIDAVGAAPLVLPIAAVGRAVRPLSPVHCTAARRPNGDLLLRWIRRSRTGFAWADGVDAPQDALPESYLLTITAGNAASSATATLPEYLIPAAQLSAWNSAGAAAVTVSVQQSGPHALSLPSLITVPL